MNITKGDVQELRRRLKKTECTFGRLCGCYVNSGKQIVTKFTEQFSELEEDEYFIADMIGIEVVTEDDKPFGTLKDVMETGANDVYVIDTDEHGEVLVPAIRECILDVDIENQKMKIHLMDGLI